MNRILAILALGLLAACQTTPPAPRPHGLSAEQVAVLEANGFRNEGSEWLLGLPDRLLFPVDGSDLDAAQRHRLQLLSRALTGIGLIGARIEGHTDSTGSAVYNRRLSLRRAEAVKQALSEGGMNAGKIATLGQGEDDPIESNDTAEGRQENRRVVVIVSADNSASPGSPAQPLRP